MQRIPQEVIGKKIPAPSLLINFFWIVLFYLNAYIFLPLLQKKKTILFISLHLLTLVIMVFSAAFIKNNSTESFGFRSGFQGIRLLVPYLFIVAVSTSYRLILDRIKANKLMKEKEELIKEKEHEALKSEMSLLRSQVSPHFMFNVLNSMVSLARKKSDVLEPSLIKLSELMRYMIYSSQEDRVLLQKEIDYLKSYIDLQSLRFQDNVKIKYDVVNESVDFPSIEPMLLIPFIENAFKHGTGYTNDPCIIIDLHITPKNELVFMVKNKFNFIKAEPVDGAAGIGLVNVNKRLELLYKNKYKLMVSKEAEWFIVKLNINLAHA